MDNKNRVVITGMGAITPIGHTVDEMWRNLVNGQSGLGRLTLLDASRYRCRVAAELKDFEPSNFLDGKKARHMSHASQIAVIAAKQALEGAGLDLDQIERDRSGVLLGTAGGSGIEETEKALRRLSSDQASRLSPFQIMRVWPNMSSYFVAETHNLRGYNATICTACAAGTQAIGEAAKVIQRGDADIMITGGTESMVSEIGMAGFSAMRALATSFNDEPWRAMRPFDLKREGFIPGQGCAILVLERLDLAVKRGARLLAEVLGFGVSNDAFHMISPDPEGDGAALAIERALDDARKTVADIDYINAHAASTPLGDLAETKAIKKVFGERAYKIPISSTKSMVGHMMGAAGAVEAVACIKTIMEGVIHPTINLENPDPDCDLDYVPNQAREAKVDVALSNSFGLGGQNASLVIGRL